MKIKEILDEIAGLSGKNDKRDALAKHKDNELLKRVIYLAHSPRIKFYIKQIPEYETQSLVGDLESALEGGLSRLSSRDLTGNDAIEHLSELLSTLSPDDAYVIERIIDKNLKICTTPLRFVFLILPFLPME